MLEDLFSYPDSSMVGDFTPRSPNFCLRAEQRKVPRGSNNHVFIWSESFFTLARLNGALMVV
jgi:hypothetical protein